MFDGQPRLLTLARAARSLAPAPVRLMLMLIIGMPGCTVERPPALRHGEIASADTFAVRHAPDAIATARVKLDPAKVPVALRTLVPLAEDWGIGDDAIRDALQERVSQAEKDALAQAVNPHNAAITAWLDSLPPAQPMSDEAAAFMYMQLGLVEMGLFEELP